MQQILTQQKIVHELTKQCQKLMKNYTTEQTLKTLCDQHKITQILPQLDIHVLGLCQQQRHITKGVGIFNIHNQYPLRITIYYLPNGEIMKLHNHPQMEVLSYLLQGKMNAKVYTPLEGDLFAKSQRVMEKGAFSYIDGLKDNNQNLHEFQALQPTYFLDVIFPDYDEEDRECYFYQEVEQISETKSRLRIVDDYEVPFRTIA